MDTIFEIGGQDSKFISIENGVVVDFAMNEACAAGTGSFLEEQAEKLGISIKGEFAKLALARAAPDAPGRALHGVHGARRHRLAAQGRDRAEPGGRAWPIPSRSNYLNRVVRGRKIGNVIYFQGGTAYNDAVTAAFASLLGKKITVPPYNGVMGAIGMALIARQWHAGAPGGQTPLPRLRPASKLELTDARFRLQGLLQPLRHEGVHHRGAEELLGRQVLRQVPQARPRRKPVIDDLFAFREEQLLAPTRRPAQRVPESAPHRRLAARHVDAGPAAVLGDATSPSWASGPCSRR